MLNYRKFSILIVVILLFCNVHKGNAQTIIKGLKQIPVLGWYSIPSDQTTVKRYQELKDAGITISLTFFPDTKSVIKALKVANKVGVKLIFSCPELKSETEKTVKNLKHYPALAGYFLQDEPWPKGYERLKKWVTEIHSVDAKHFCYVNLLPNYAPMQPMGVKDYREYVHKFIQEVPVKLLSFDFYPVIGDTIRNLWYKNLEVFSDEARKAGKPFWAFALTSSLGPYPIPTIAQLRLQVYSNLAYGAQGIEYFTYWTPSVKYNYPGPISTKGERSEVYNRIKLMDKEIRNLSNVFWGAKVVSVFHTGKIIPPGTMRPTNLPTPIKKLSTNGSGAIVSILKKRKYKFLVIVNSNFKRNMKLTVECDPSLMKILKDGSAVPANDYMETMSVSPGDIAIYRWNNK